MRMKKKLITVGRALLSALLALLGFSGCEDPNPTIGPDAYGPLYADFRYQGTETNAPYTVPSSDMIEISSADNAELTPHVE